MRRILPLLASLVACGPSDDDDPAPVPTRPVFPAPDAWGPTTGPGLGAPPAGAPPFEACAYLSGDRALTADHHNLVVMHDGYLVFPWSPEDGGGGLSILDVSDPCDPVLVGEGWSPLMRESHSLAFQEVDGRTYVAVNHLAEDGPGGGVGFWDITDPTDPVWVSQVEVPGHRYPDSYLFLTLSVFWQGRYVFAASALHGVFVIDAADPLAPEVVGQIAFEGPHLVGSFHVWGNVAMAASAGPSRVVMVDVSDPLDPLPIPGGDFDTVDAAGAPIGFYFANVGSRYGLFARSSDGGGPIVYDLTDPARPTLVSTTHTPDGDGGYLFQQNDHLFLGDSNFGTVYDFSDPAAPADVGTFTLKGDLDTVTPLGGLAVVAVDEKGDAGQASAIMPWSTDPDTTPPSPGMTSPVDGATNQALTSRIGVAFDEMLEPRSAFPGSVRVYTTDGVPIEATFQVQENLLNVSPRAPLPDDATIVVELVAGGLVDVSGNALADDHTFRFSTGSTVDDTVLGAPE